MSDDAARGSTRPEARRVRPQVHEPAVLGTYRSLRLAIVLLVALLGAGIVAQALDAGCWQTSVSAYYWTAAHDAVVGALCGIGACLLVYRGSSPLEDALLDTAGLLAFVVAFVPTEREPLCGGPVLPVEQLPAAGVRDNLLAAVVVGAVAQVLRLVLVRRPGGMGVPAAVVRVVTGVGTVALATALVLDPDGVAAAAHHWAAPAFFVPVVLAVVVAAREARARGSRFAVAYGSVALGMLVTLVLVAALRPANPGWTHAVLAVEALLVAEFAAYWLLQTVELWHVAHRGELGPRRAPGAGDRPPGGAHAPGLASRP